MSRLIKIFPEYSPEFIRTKLDESDNSAKKCIELIMKEKEKKLVNKSLEIEEWSDGDEKIRAKNLENKLKRLSKESQESDEVTGVIDKKRKSTVNEGIQFLVFKSQIHLTQKS